MLGKTSPLVSPSEIVIQPIKMHPVLHLLNWRTEMVPERSLGVQDVSMDARNNFSFCVSFRKCHLTHQDATCPPSLELDLWRTGMVPDRSVHFNVSNNSTL